MSRSDPQVNFRMPAELKAQLEEAAGQNKRSTTAEIVSRLQESFSPRISNTSIRTVVKGDLVTLDSAASLEQLEQLVERAVKRALDSTAKN